MLDSLFIRNIDMVIYFIHLFLSPFYNKMPRIRTAHKFTERQRTGDVLTDEFVDFKSLLLSSDVLKGLSSSGFERPSPIQLKAIPLGRCGLGR